MKEEIQKKIDELSSEVSKWNNLKSELSKSADLTSSNVQTMLIALEKRGSGKDKFHLDILSAAYENWDLISKREKPLLLLFVDLYFSYTESSDFPNRLDIYKQTFDKTPYHYIVDEHSQFGNFNRMVLFTSEEISNEELHYLYYLIQTLETSFSERKYLKWDGQHLMKTKIRTKKIPSWI